MRFNSTERLGVVSTDLVVTKELGWIFREQSLIDVGIDALIEQSENGNPTGKFLAVQIKSGKGNFHLTQESIIYYVSNVHYHYWLNINIPIILVTHFPETEKTYWQHISKNTLKKARKHWKIETPLNKLFNINAKTDLIKLLHDSEKSNVAALELFKGRVDESTIYDMAEDTECISDSVAVIKRITSILSELKEKTESFNNKLRNYTERGLSDKDPQVKAGIKGFAKDLNVISKRLEGEINLYSELYAHGIYAFEQISILSFSISKNSEEFNNAFKNILEIPNALEYALKGITEMKGGIVKLPTKYSSLKEARNLLNEIVKMNINEFIESKTMTERIIINLKKLI
jgi:hypothetical protein